MGNKSLSKTLTDDAKQNLEEVHIKKSLPAAHRPKAVVDVIDNKGSVKELIVDIVISAVVNCYCCCD